MVVARLEDKFFQENQASAAFFDTWRHQGPWNAEFFPVASWEGILYIACALEAPPTTMEMNWCVVQASPSAMYTWWVKYQEQTENLSLDATVVMSTDTLDAETDVTSDLLDLGLGQPAEIPTTPVTPEMVPIAPSFSLASLKRDSPTEFPPLPTEDGFGDAGMGSAQLAPDPVPPPSPEVTASSHLVPDQLQSFFAPIWETLRVYTPEILFAVRDSNRLFVQLVSGPGLTHLEGQSLDLSLPSPFRIALRTQRAYLGPIAVNIPCNDLFRKMLERSSYPACLVVVPVVMFNECVAFLIGWGPEPTADRALLNAYQQQADLIAGELQRIHHKSAA